MNLAQDRAGGIVRHHPRVLNPADIVRWGDTKMLTRLVCGECTQLVEAYATTFDKTIKGAKGLLHTKIPDPLIEQPTPAKRCPAKPSCRSHTQCGQIDRHDKTQPPCKAVCQPPTIDLALSPVPLAMEVRKCPYK